MYFTRIVRSLKQRNISLQKYHTKFVKPYLRGIASQTYYSVLFYFEKSLRFNIQRSCY